MKRFKKRILAALLLVVLVISFSGCSSDSSLIQFESPKDGQTVAEIVVKDYGSIKVMLFEEQAPKAVENFVTHAQEGYYDGLTFHRVIADFMIQAAILQVMEQAAKAFGASRLKMNFPMICVILPVHFLWQIWVQIQTAVSFSLCAAQP